MHVTWSKENKELLAKLYNEHKTDVQIAEVFNSTASAVGKQRSILGLTARKIAYHKRKDRTIIPPPDCNKFIAYYIENGKDHFSNLGCEEEAAKVYARKILVKKQLKEITILRPYCKLMFQNVLEIKF